MLHKTLSRKGGQVRSPAKTKANRAKAAAYWADARAGRRPASRRPRTPPTPEDLAEKLAPFCRDNHIARLEVFGSVSQGGARRGSDVDLMVTFEHPIGLRFFSLEQELSQIVGAPVDLLTRESVERMTNQHRRDSILSHARQIYPS